MVSVGITARFPLGVYHGHLFDGSPDPLPSPARLFSALVNAAHTGTTAGPDGDVAPDVADVLAWFEENPPDGLFLPAYEPLTDTRGRVAYRDHGTVEKFAAKVAPKAMSDGTAVNGLLGWSWADMPDITRQTLVRLLEDVPSLGEADSPVVLEIDEVKPNWCLDVGASAFTPGGRVVPVATIGRREALEGTFAQARPPRPPSVAKDRQAKSDRLMIFPPSDQGLMKVRYASIGIEEDPNSLPWRDVYVFPMDDGTGRALTPEHRVKWCVAFHRALVGRIGDGAPPVVTGRYPEGIPVPANRIAIQYMPASLLAQSVVGDLGMPGAFVVMVPSTISAPEAEVVLDGLDALSFIRTRWAAPPLAMHEEVFDAAAFWKPSALGMSRLWSPMPAAVPEVVKQRGRWTFEDAILLSLGFVWRDHLGSVEHGAKGYRSLVEQVRAQGAEVLWHRSLNKDPAAYAHRMPQGMVAQPYTAQISSGSLSDATTLIAIGQSRHLGGGLLVPVDLPTEVVQAALRKTR